MNNEQARAIFEAVIAQHIANGNIEQADKTRTLMEFLTNSDFRQTLTEYSREVNNVE